MTNKILQEDGVSGLLLEDGSGYLILDLLPVSQTFTGKYDMHGNVSNVFNAIYDIDGTVLTNLKAYTGHFTIPFLNIEYPIFIKGNGPLNYATKLNLKNMASGDIIVVTIYYDDENDGSWVIYDQKTIRGAQTKPGDWFPWLTSTKYKVTIKQTAGTLRDFPWTRYETP